MMAQFPNDDEKLVTFLKYYRPVPPPVAADFEARLITQIERHSLVSGRPRRLLWAIPSAIVVGLLTWGGYRWLNPEPQIATNPDELESFLISSWNGTFSETTFTQTNSPEADWLILTAPEAKSSTSRP